jgi:hypothetical protein
VDSAIPPTELGIVSPGECNLEMLTSGLLLSMFVIVRKFGLGFSLFSAMAFAERRAGEFLSPSGFVRVGLD